MKSDYDGAWKNLLHNYLRESLEFFFPTVAVGIDWKAKPDFLDQELRQLELSDDAGGNRVDLLVRVGLLNGESEIIHLHIEVQSFEEKGFAKRLYSCFQGVSRSVGLNVVTLAILADLEPNWKPDCFEYQKLGCRVRFEFPVCKLLEVIDTLDEDHLSLPALAAIAQIEALRTSRVPDKRLAARLILVRRLLRHGFDQSQIRAALRLISWMMKLPKKQSLQFREKFLALETMHATYPLTDIEELLIEEHKDEWLREGIEKGIEKGIERGRGEGREEGREEGEWIGKILLLEKLMGRRATPRSHFKGNTVSELKSKFCKLEKEYFRETR